MEHLRYAGSLRSFMKLIPMSDYRMWMVRLDELWNEPDRHDHYLMAIRTDLAVFGGGSGDINKAKLNFRNAGEAPIDPTIKSKTYVEQRIAEAKANAETGVLVRGKRPNE